MASATFWLPLGLPNWTSKITTKNQVPFSQATLEWGARVTGIFTFIASSVFDSHEPTPATAVVQGAPRFLSSCVQLTQERPGLFWASHPWESSRHFQFDFLRSVYILMAFISRRWSYILFSTLYTKRGQTSLSKSNCLKGKQLRPARDADLVSCLVLYNVQTKWDFLHF